MLNARRHRGGDHAIDRDGHGRRLQCSTPGGIGAAITPGTGRGPPPCRGAQRPEASGRRSPARPSAVRRSSGALTQFFWNAKNVQLCGENLGRAAEAMWLTADAARYKASALARIGPPPLTRNDPVRERHRQADRVARGMLLLVWRAKSTRWRAPTARRGPAACSKTTGSLPIRSVSSGRWSRPRPKASPPEYQQLPGDGRVWQAARNPQDLPVGMADTSSASCHQSRPARRQHIVLVGVPGPARQPSILAPRSTRMACAGAGSLAPDRTAGASRSPTGGTGQGSIRGEPEIVIRVWSTSAEQRWVTSGERRTFFKGVVGPSEEKIRALESLLEAWSDYLEIPRDRIEELAAASRSVL